MEGRKERRKEKGMQVYQYAGSSLCKDFLLIIMGRGKEGRKEGREEGRKEGKKEGRLEERKEGMKENLNAGSSLCKDFLLSMRGKGEGSKENIPERWKFSV